MTRTVSPRFVWLALAGLVASATVAPIPVQAATVDQEFWLSRTVTRPGTRVFTGRMGGQLLWLRLAPLPGGANVFRGTYTLASPGPSKLEEHFVDGTLAAGSLELRETSFNWDKEKVVSQPAFTLRGFGGAFPALLAGTGSDGKTTSAVTLREQSFGLPRAASTTVRRIDQNFPGANYSVTLLYSYTDTEPIFYATYAFDREVVRLADASATEMKTQMKGFNKGLDPKIKIPAGYDAGAFELSWAANGLASGDLIQDVYYGGAHGVMIHSPLTYDLTRRRQLGLRDLFKPGAPYLPTLASLSRTALHRALVGSEDTKWLAEGTQPKTANYRVWALTPLGLRLTFTNYQIGPYAQGESSVVLPYAALKKLLRPGMAARLNA